MKQRTPGSSPSITVGDIAIPTEIRSLHVTDLRYYKDNPRIFSILKQFGDAVKQEEIERQLWEQDATHDLYRDIQQNGGLVEEIIVRDREVLEGNSRLCAYRYLLKHAKEKNDQDDIRKWEWIRAKILPEDTDDKTVFAILGMLHIRGKAEWKPYEQASYLFRQATTYRMKPGELAAQIGHGEAEVKNMIEAYKLMEKHRIKIRVGLAISWNSRRAESLQTAKSTYQPEWICRRNSVSGSETTSFLAAKPFAIFPRFSRIRAHERSFWVDKQVLKRRWKLQKIDIPKPPPHFTTSSKGQLKP